MSIMYIFAMIVNPQLPQRDTSPTDTCLWDFPHGLSHLSCQTRVNSLELLCVPAVMHRPATQLVAGRRFKNHIAGHGRGHSTSTKEQTVLQTFLGAGILALTVLAFLDRRARVRGRKLLRAPAVTPAVLQAATIVVVVLSVLLVAPAIFPRLRVGLFAFCAICPIGTVAQGDAITLGEFGGAFLLACWYYAATVIPVFIVPLSSPACSSRNPIASECAEFSVHSLSRRYSRSVRAA